MHFNASVVDPRTVMPRTRRHEVDGIDARADAELPKHSVRRRANRALGLAELVRDQLVGVAVRDPAGDGALLDQQHPRHLARAGRSRMRRRSGDRRRRSNRQASTGLRRGPPKCGGRLRRHGEAAGRARNRRGPRLRGGRRGGTSRPLRRALFFPTARRNHRRSQLPARRLRKRSHQPVPGRDVGREQSEMRMGSGGRARRRVRDEGNRDPASVRVCRVHNHEVRDAEPSRALALALRRNLGHERVGCLRIRRDGTASPIELHAERERNVRKGVYRSVGNLLRRADDHRPLHAPSARRTARIVDVRHTATAVVEERRCGPEYISKPRVRARGVERVTGLDEVDGAWTCHHTSTTGGSAERRTCSWKTSGAHSGRRRRARGARRAASRSISA